MDAPHPFFLVAAFTLWASAVPAEEAGPGRMALADFMSREREQPSGLTAEHAAQRALESSLEVERQRAAVRVSSERKDAAEAAYLPTVSLLARYTRLSTRDDTSAGSIVVAPGAPAGPIAPGTPLVNAPLSFEALPNQYTLEAALTVPVSDYLSRLPAQRESAGAGLRASEHLVAVERVRAASAARAAYYDWARARLGVVVAERGVHLSRTHLSDVENALAAGSATSADVARVRAELARAELLVQELRSSERLAERALRQRMHDAGAAPLAIGEDLTAEPATDPSDEPGLVRRALARRAELRAIDERVSAARSAAEVERSAALPRLELFGVVAYQNPDPRSFPQRDAFAASWQAGAQLLWVPTAAPAAAARGRSSEEEAQELLLERRVVEERIELEVAAALESVRRGRAALAATAASLAAAEDSYRARRLLFQNGRATSSELLDAETELVRAELAAVDARIDLRLGRVALGAALGTP